MQLLNHRYGEYGTSSGERSRPDSSRHPSRPRPEEFREAALVGSHRDGLSFDHSIQSERG